MHAFMTGVVVSDIWIFNPLLGMIEPAGFLLSELKPITSSFIDFCSHPSPSAHTPTTPTSPQRNRLSYLPFKSCATDAREGYQEWLAATIGPGILDSEPRAGVTGRRSWRSVKVKGGVMCGGTSQDPLCLHLPGEGSFSSLSPSVRMPQPGPASSAGRTWATLGPHYRECQLSLSSSTRGPELCIIKRQGPAHSGHAPARSGHTRTQTHAIPECRKNCQIECQDVRRHASWNRRRYASIECQKECVLGCGIPECRLRYAR